MSRFDPFEAPNRTHLWARLIVDELARCGVGHAVIGPGSRSTPLTVAAARHPEISDRIHFDERGGAFHALGIARATRTPVAWITTSGTAVANGLPAVMEAARDHVPLVLCTADRPPELRETGSNQTVDQVNVFGPRVRASFDLPAPEPRHQPEALLTTVDQLLRKANGPPAGPVHLNCMYRKPLEPVDDPSFERSVPTPLESWHDSRDPYTRYPAGRPPVPADDRRRLVELLRPDRRGLVLPGRISDPHEAEATRRIAEHLGWPLLPDVSSQLRLGARSAISAPLHELILRSSFRDRYQPDLVLQVGDRPVSKPLRTYLRERAPAHRVVLAPHADRIDPDHRVTHRFTGSASSVHTALVESDRDARSPDEWTTAWIDAQRRAERALDRALDLEGPCTEPAIARVLTAEIPDTHALFLGNSRPVRDAHAFGASDGPAAPTITNRGASGIDGSIATTAGFLVGSDGPVTALIGDLALLHDLNSLALLPDGDRPVVLVVINNDGGGIFHFLPIAEYSEVFESHFGTPHGMHFADAASQFDLAYARPESIDSFRTAYREAAERPGSTLVEVVTDRVENRRLHERLSRTVAEAVEDGIPQRDDR